MNPADDVLYLIIADRFIGEKCGNVININSQFSVLLCSLFTSSEKVS